MEKVGYPGSTPPHLIAMLLDVEGALDAELLTKLGLRQGGNVETIDSVVELKLLFK